MPTKRQYVVALHATSAEPTGIFPLGSLALSAMPQMLESDANLELHFMNGAAFVQTFKPADGAFPWFIEKQVATALRQPESYMLVVMNPALAERVAREYFRGQQLPHLLQRNLLRPVSAFEPTEVAQRGAQAFC